MSLVLTNILSYKGLYSDNVDSSQIFYNEMAINIQLLQKGKQNGFPLPASRTHPWVFETEIYKEKVERFLDTSLFSGEESICKHLITFCEWAYRQLRDYAFQVPVVRALV